MINKKILLSLLSVGLLACIASAGTWAYFQDTVTSTDNQLTTATLTSQYSLDGGTNWNTFSGDTGNNFGPFNITNLLPGDGGTLQNISIRNMGTTSARVFATITPTALGGVDDLVIYVGGHPIYGGYSGFPAAFAPFTLDLGNVSAGGISPVDASITYDFAENGNQNSMEGQDVIFDMSIAMKATH